MEAQAEPFSAREFFRAYTRGVANESVGELRSLLQLPGPSGPVMADTAANGSLRWVDGLVQQAQATELMIEAVRQGSVPPPCSTRASPLSGVRVRFTDPEKLCSSPCTVLSLFQCEQQLVSSATKAAAIHCEKCGVVAPRFRRPHELCRVLLDALQGESAVISVASSSETLKNWSDQVGFSDTSVADGNWCTRIDSGPVNDSLIAALTPVLRSTWRFPDFHLKAQSRSGIIRLAPHGICPSCDRIFSPITSPRIESIVRGGLALGNPKGDEHCLDLGGLSIREALATPIGSTPFPDALRAVLPEEFRLKLLALGLGHLPLGASTTSLSSAELCLASLAATLRDRSALAVIDLPRGIVSNAVAAVVETLINAPESRPPTVIVGSLPTARSHEFQHQEIQFSSEPPLGTLHSPTGERPLRRGLVVLPGEAPSPNWETALAAKRVSPSEGTSIVSLRVFDSYSSKRTTLIELLNLFEPLCKLFTSSIDAKTFGLSVADLALRPRGNRGFACRDCHGLGVQLEPLEQINRPKASRCSSCAGARFIGGVEKLLFRGLSISQILNTTVIELRPMLRALPKSTPALELLTLLDLEHLPVGMPLALLSFSERRRIQLLAAALAGRNLRRPQIALVELPFAGLSERHACSVEKLLRTSEFSPHTCWVVNTPQNS